MFYNYVMLLFCSVANRICGCARLTSSGLSLSHTLSNRILILNNAVITITKIVCGKSAFKTLVIMEIKRILEKEDLNSCNWNGKKRTKTVGGGNFYIYSSNQAKPLKESEDIIFRITIGKLSYIREFVKL